MNCFYFDVIDRTKQKGKKKKCFCIVSGFSISRTRSWTFVFLCFYVNLTGNQNKRSKESIFLCFSDFSICFSDFSIGRTRSCRSKKNC